MRSLARPAASLFGAVALLILLAIPSSGKGQNTNPAQAKVSISVLGLFHPKELRLSPAKGSSLTLHIGEDLLQLSGDSQVVIRIGNRADGSEIEVAIGVESGSQSMRARNLRLDALGNGDADFWLEVPGKLRRQYSGLLEISNHGQTLEAVVTMPLETAVASIVEAESPARASLEALKAQAVATRSFLVARQTSHRAGGEDFDFCDTTHCQFLRSPPLPDNPAARAARATVGTILTYHDASIAQEKPLPAMYARSCGGRTRTLAQIGIHAASGYPYYAVRCTYCLHHPAAQHRQPGAAFPKTEQERLAWNRIHGWSAIPSLTGSGTGHGIGLCQLGAADMARHGAGFAEILAHYYPNTRLSQAQQP